MLARFNPKNYLFFKIFIWFWLTIVLCLGLLFLFSQLTDDNIKSSRLTGPKLENLKLLANSIERSAKFKPNKTIEQLASQHRIARHRLLFISEAKTNTSFFNQTRSKELDMSLLGFTHELPPQVITTNEYRALGPVTVTHRGQSYRVYDIEPWRNTPLAIRIMLIPTWLKVAIVLSASLLLSLLFSRNLIKPINALKKASSLLANGQLDARVNIKEKTGDELTSLANHFNAMAQRLEALVSSQKRLMADVSHELRSPLTRLQMATGLAQLKQTPEQESYLLRIEKEANNLEKMIADVLKLARLEVNNQYIQMDKQPLQAIISQVVKDAEFESEQQHKTLVFNGTLLQSITCDAALLASAFENILRNAIRYAKTTVYCDVAETQTGIVVTIRDDGNGVNEQELPYLLEPFYRVSQSRQRENGGAGLGLAIAKQAIELHQGTLTLSSPKDSGLIVTIILNYD